MGNKKSCRATVFGRKIFVVKTERNPRLLVQKIFQRQIRSVVSVGMNQSIAGIGFYIGEYRIEGNALPRCAEFRPARNAVQINREGLGGQVAKRLPIPSPQSIVALVNLKFPLIERHVRRRSRGKDGEVCREVLPWR